MSRRTSSNDHMIVLALAALRSSSIGATIILYKTVCRFTNIRVWTRKGVPQRSHAVPQIGYRNGRLADYHYVWCDYDCTIVRVSH